MAVDGYTTNDSNADVPVPNPKSDRLLDKLNRLKSEFFSDYHTNIDKNRRSYNRDYQEDVVPPTWRARLVPQIPQTSRRAVDEPADHMLPYPQIKVPVRHTQAKNITEREIAERKREFLNAWWTQVTDRYNVIGDGRKPLLREGRICVKHSLRWDLVPERGNMSTRKWRSLIDRLGRYDFLWKTELLDNKTVFEDPDNHRDPTYVYVQYEVLVEDAKEDFPDAKGDWRKLEDLHKVRYTELWTKPTFNPDGSYDPGDYIQWIEDERVSEDENPYPYLPIAIEDAGYGDTYKGVTIARKYVGIAEHSFDMFVAEARQMTSWEAVAELTAFAPVIARNMSNSTNLTVGPGEIINLEGDKGQPGAQELEPMEWPEIPEAVVKLVDKTTQYANLALKMDTLGGVPLSGVDTATEADQQIRNASSKLEGPLSALERIANKISRWVLMDVELVLESPVSVYGTKSVDPNVATITPKDISGFYNASCEFRTSDADAVSQVKARFWAEMYRVVPFLSAMTAMERGEITDNPLQEMTKRAAEDILLSDEFRTIRTTAAAQAYGTLTDMMNVLKMNQAPNENTGIPTGAGMPAGPNSAEGLIAQPDILSSPERNALFDASLVNRDVLRGPSQLQ